MKNSTAAARGGEKPPSADRIGAKLDEAMARGLTLQDRFIRMVESVRAHLSDDHWPEARREAVVHRVLEYIDAISHSDCIARGNVDAYVDLTGRFRMDLQQLEQPVRSLTQREQWQLAAVRLGWDDELDLLLRVLTSGETIAKLEWDRAVLSSGREVSRRALRLTRKESYSPFDDDEFIARNFKPMRQPQAV